MVSRQGGGNRRIGWGGMGREGGGGGAHNLRLPQPGEQLWELLGHGRLLLQHNMGGWLYSQRLLQAERLGLELKGEEESSLWMMLRGVGSQLGARDAIL